REAMAQNIGELLKAPPELLPQLQQQLYDRELNRLIERELILEEAMRRIESSGKKQILKQLQKAASEEADRRLRDIKAAVKAKSDDDVKAMLQSQGLTVGGMRTPDERNFMMVMYARNIIEPATDRISLVQIKDYYEQ